MTTVHDVVAYILHSRGPMTTWKLQKLVYYCQAWHLVWEEEPLFESRIEAWANGPVVRDLYALHRGQFKVETWPQGDPDRLSAEQRETVDSVLEFYGGRTSQWLSDLTHSESPWQEARGGLKPGERGTREIEQASLLGYYSGLSDSASGQEA